MNKNIEGVLAIIAALFVLLSAMFDPKVPMVISVAALVGLGVYSFIKN